MECDICNKEADGQDDLLCASCARSLVYMSRLEVARVLLENEGLNQQALSVVESSVAPADTDTGLQLAQQTWREDIENAEKSAIRSRIEETRLHTSRTKDEIEQLKIEIAEKKSRLALKKNALSVINQTVPDRRSTSINALSEIRDKGMTSFSNASHKSANTRAFLCRETAVLLGLRQRKKQKRGAVAEQYTITGVILPDLKEINTTRCTDLTAALTSTSHLLVLVAFYLGVRLPAEITVPHRDYPLPTINTPAQSYLGQRVAFPGSGSINTAPSSPFSSRHDVKGPYRPRPLFIGSDDRDEKVAQFAKRDPTAFNFFVEGVSLLAWNIAWLCRTQGFSNGTSSWEDICNIGRNLYQLILGQPQSSALLRVLSGHEIQMRQRPNSGTSTPVLEGNILPFAKLGQTSHLSAHAFLGQASFSEHFRTWKYSKYNTISDALRKLLVTEMNNAEWELLQEQEWDDGGEQFDEAVFIKARATDGREYDDARSIMTTKPHIENDDQQATSERDSSKPKGTSGWTKLKSRSDG